MALYKLEDFYPNYREEIFDGEDIKGLEIYTEHDEKVGTVSNALLDEEGRFRYLVMDTGFWIFGKKVLLPVGRFLSDPKAQRIYIKGLSKAQAENLPEYDESMTVDFDYEEKVRGVYRMAPLESPVPLDLPPINSVSSGSSKAPVIKPTAVPAHPTYNRDTYTYQQEPSLFEMNAQEQNLKLYEERLVANKHRRKAGEVLVGKHLETKIAQVSVPVKKERVVIERSGMNSGEAVYPNSVELQEGEIARVEVYEETANVRKEAFVREEVKIRKEISQDTVNVQEQLRREELDVDTQGTPILERRID